mmetsp:Transcript_116821/g.337523  ORF Transcript_116821/g.337523 Transcript_116821/m.337523 type:complete len:152 (-) Transcript_116821:159-614(-)
MRFGGRCLPNNSLGIGSWPRPVRVVLWLSGNKRSYFFGFVHDLVVSLGPVVIVLLLDGCFLFLCVKASRGLNQIRNDVIGGQDTDSLLFFFNGSIIRPCPVIERFGARSRLDDLRSLGGFQRMGEWEELGLKGARQEVTKFIVFKCLGNGR